MEKKRSWYDGHFYDRFIAPNQDNSFLTIRQLIPENSTVLDLGCGTGRLVYQLADSCKKVTGVDVSLENINVAASKQKAGGIDNIEFIHADFNEFIRNNGEKFDFAVLSYVLHEVYDAQRIQILSNLKRIADKIIISDYLVPMPRNFWGALTYIVEFLAGTTHYSNFKNFITLGGIEHLINSADLKNLHEFKEKSKTSHIALLESK
jgi:ubiquinone/menaquinone biosynthesis C-methylase UbiE